ncbi:MAG: hypothetical protein QOH71_2885 [Blastocatellia bacterium]|jgi:hypothetical protein|nr:hypothetical protein [Blastocatellia bacterium]
MWKTLLTILQNVLTLARDLEENRKEIRELNEKLYSLASVVRSLSEKIEANAQLGESERKALILQLENELLRVRNESRSLNARPRTARSKKATKK